MNPRMNHNKKPENKAQGILRKRLETLGCVVHKLHGGMYQAGLPDLLVIRPDGWVVFVEMKWVDRSRITQIEVISLLDTPQRGVMFWIRRQTKAKMFVVVGSPEGFSAVRIPPLLPDNQVNWVDTDKMADFILSC